MKNLLIILTFILIIVTCTTNEAKSLPKRKKAHKEYNCKEVGKQKVKPYFYKQSKKQKQVLHVA